MATFLAAEATAANVEVSFANHSAVTDSNAAALIGMGNASVDTGDGRVAIDSGLTGTLSTTSFDAVSDTATGEVGMQWGIEADHCLGAGGCGGVDHFVDATGDLTVVITVASGVASWELELGVQSFGNINGIVDGGTLPACTSVMSAPVLVATATGGASACVDTSTGTHTSLSDSGDCTQDSDWFKDEDTTVTVSGTGSGTFELHLAQDASVTSERQTNPIAIKNGSDTCYRAGMDPGDGIAFFDACDYPGLAAANGDRNTNAILGDVPPDGGVWVTDRVNGTAIELTALELLPPPPVPALSPVWVVALAGLLLGTLRAAGARTS